MKQAISWFLLLVLSLPLGAQTEKKGWSIAMEAETFFRNNEYSAPYGTGYTLPGYKLAAKGAYEKRFSFGMARLEGGVYAMGYFGAKTYPKGTWFAELPHWTDQSEVQRGARLLPLVGITYVPNEHLTLRMGLLDRTLHHGLIAPLYNPELRYTADPEQGVQFVWNYPAFRGDVWIDWQSFIFRADRHQEAFTAGLTTSFPLCTTDAYRIEGSVQAIATHRGGEINWLRSDTVHTYAATSLGVKQTLSPFASSPDKTLSLETYFLLSSMRTAEPNNPIGKGIYVGLEFASRRLSVATSYWRGWHFVTPMGGPFVNSRALWEGPYVADASQTSYLSLKGHYAFIKGRSLSLGLQAQAWYHLLPTTSKSRLSHALELYLSFMPQWKW